MENAEANLKLIEDGTINGRAALEILQQSGRYVFHGSPNRLDMLEPRQAHQHNSETGENIPDGEPAVFASENFEQAIFKGLVSQSYNFGPGKRVSGWDGSSSKLHYYAQGDLLEKARLESSKAYVHVFLKGDFDYVRGSEHRAHKPVKPKFIVEVNGSDLPENIESR